MTSGAAVAFVVDEQDWNRSGEGGRRKRAEVSLEQARDELEAKVQEWTAAPL
ncbi:MAG TPA: hypothetical protein VNP53_11985 [Methylomirabilota bacterium]|nr:hypothetical protein [Methylomirabilota bacterium]